MKESSTGTWFQSEEAWRFYCACAEWLTPFHTEVKRGERIVGMVTGYITKEQRMWKQRFSCRAVINGGPLLAADATTEEVKTLLLMTEAEIKKLSKGQIIYIETRNFVDLSPWREAFEQAGWEYKAHYDIHVDCRDGERLWQRIHESKKRAIARGGVEEERGRGVGKRGYGIEEKGMRNIGEWYAMLEKLYKTKVHRPLWPLAFFEQAIEMGVGELLVVIAPNPAFPPKGKEERGMRNEERGKVMGGMFVVKDEKRVYEWYVVGSVPVTYAGLRYAVETGREVFDFMGAGEPGKPYGVRDFKMQFGGELKELGRWIRVCKRGYYNLGKLIVNANILG